MQIAFTDSYAENTRRVAQAMGRPAEETVLRAILIEPPHGDPILFLPGPKKYRIMQVINYLFLQKWGFTVGEEVASFLRSWAAERVSSTGKRPVLQALLTEGTRVSDATSIVNGAWGCLDALNPSSGGRIRTVVILVLRAIEVGELRAEWKDTWVDRAVIIARRLGIL